MRGKPNKSTRRIHPDHLRVVPRKQLRAALQFFDEPHDEGTMLKVAAGLANRNPDLLIQEISSMTKVYEHKARKDYPQFGIAKGDTYYEWCFYRQKPTKSKTRPTRIQLTQNETEIAVWSEYDHLDEATFMGDDRSAVVSLIDDMVGNLETAADEVRQKFENMPEGLQQGDTGQRLERMADAIDEAVSELQSLSSDCENGDDENQPLSGFYELVQATEPDLS
jgi:hypothetical protein